MFDLSTQRREATPLFQNRVNNVYERPVSVSACVGLVVAQKYIYIYIHI